MITNMSDMIAWYHKIYNGGYLGGGTLNGVSYAESNYFAFDGVDDYIEFASGNLFSSTDSNPQPWTVAMHIWNDGTSGALLSDIGLDGSINFSIELDTSKRLHIYWNNTEVYSYTSSYSTYAASWRPLIITYDGTTLKVYNRITLTSPTPRLMKSVNIALVHKTKNSTSKFRIGANAAKSNNNYFKGKMKDIRIYKIALTEEDIKGMHGVQFQSYGKKCVYALKFYEKGPNNGYLVTGADTTNTFTLPATPTSIDNNYEIYRYEVQGPQAPYTQWETITCKRCIYYSNTYTFTRPVQLIINIGSLDNTTSHRFSGSYSTGYWGQNGYINGKPNYTWNGHTEYWAHQYYQLQLEILNSSNSVVATHTLFFIDNSPFGIPDQNDPMLQETFEYMPPIENVHKEIPLNLNDNGNGVKFRIKLVVDEKNNNYTPTGTARPCTVEKNLIQLVSMVYIKDGSLYCSSLTEQDSVTTSMNNGALTTEYFKEI